MFIERPPSLPPSSEAGRRKAQLKMIATWRDRGLKSTSRRLKIDPKDLTRYHQRKSSHEGMGMYSTEASAFAEYMLLEGADADGVTQGHYAWFGDSVIAYEPTDLDDVLSGADAILMFMDAENERRAYPVVVDVATQLRDVPSKQQRDYEHFVPAGHANLSKAYWYDSAVDAAGDAFDEPKEGKIPSLHLTVYIPADFGEQFADPGVSVKKIDAMMKYLGPFVVKQMQIELEAQALLLLRGFDRMDIHTRQMEVRSPLRSREAVVSALGHLAKKSLDQNSTAARMLAGILPTVWEAVDRFETAGGFSQQDRLLMQQANFFQGFDGLTKKALKVAG